MHIADALSSPIFQISGFTTARLVNHINILTGSSSKQCHFVLKLGNRLA